MSQADFTLPYLILVEGPGDAAFFRNLITERGILNEFHVRCPQDAPNVRGSGNTRFREALDGFVLIPGFENLRGIIIATDNDDDPAASFEKVQNQIRLTSRRHPVPLSPLSKTNGTPPLTVMMIPWQDEIGSLETICVHAAEVAYPDIAACADRFQDCVGISGWQPHKKSKVKLRSIISAKHRRNSDMSLAFLWDDAPDLVPLKDGCFDRIADFLNSFGAFLLAD